MPDVWVPGVRRLTPSKSGGVGSDFPSAGPHMIWHSTESPSGQGIDGVAAVLRAKGAEPHFVYDPGTDTLGQFFPVTQFGRALENDSRNGRRTNRVGNICIQIEVCAYASKPFTGTGVKFGPNFRKLGALLDQWGVPHRWPAGRPAGPEGPFPRPDLYYTTPGHYSHGEVPGQAGGHWDPGHIDIDRLFAELYQEDEVTDEDIDKIAEAVVVKLLGKPPEGAKVGDQIRVPDDSAYAKANPTNKFVSLGTAATWCLDRLLPKSTDQKG